MKPSLGHINLIILL